MYLQCCLATKAYCRRSNEIVGRVSAPLAASSLQRLRRSAPYFDLMVVLGHIGALSIVRREGRGTGGGKGREREQAP